MRRVSFHLNNLIIVLVARSASEPSKKQEVESENSVSINSKPIVTALMLLTNRGQVLV